MLGIPEMPYLTFINKFRDRGAKFYIYHIFFSEMSHLVREELINPPPEVIFIVDVHCKLPIKNCTSCSLNIAYRI